MSLEETVKENIKKDEGVPFYSYSNLKSLTILVLGVLAIRWSVASPYHVPTASMEPTIKVGDRLLAFKLAYGLKVPFTDVSVTEWAEVNRGDIIVFRYPLDPSVDYVKRVIGVAGDKIQVINDNIYINGEMQPRVDSNGDRSILEDIKDTKEIKHLYTETLDGHKHWVIQNVPGARRYMGVSWPPDGVPYIVPEGSVFVMGDNRDNSTDSRQWGEVPLKNVRGKALNVIWSFYSGEKPWYQGFRFYRFGTSLN